MTRARGSNNYSRKATGKQGKSIIPVDLEDIAKPEDYGADRVFVYLKLKGTADESFDEKVALLRDSGQPTIEIVLEDKMNLGQEFFRWEFATAVAGAIMNINPFDQPDVEAAKIEAKKLTSKNTRKKANCRKKNRFTSRATLNFLRATNTPKVWKNSLTAKRL